MRETRQASRLSVMSYYSELTDLPLLASTLDNHLSVNHTTIDYFTPVFSSQLLGTTGEP